MSRIKILFISKLTKDHLMALPSNFSYYVKELMKYEDMEVLFLNPTDTKGNIITYNWRIAKKIRRMSPDILYLTLWMGLNNLVLLKILGLINCRIAIWKYTYCKDSRNLLMHFFYKRVYWRAIDRVYMMFDNHSEDALTKRLLTDKQVVTLSRGTDIGWYSQFPRAAEKEFMLIATGKDHRDYMTLAQACEDTETRCEIITDRHSNSLDVAEKFKDSKYVKFIFMNSGYQVESYRFVVSEVAKASAMAICCEKLPYGAGYTNIIECLAFRIPIIQTLNPDVHLDPEKQGIGFSVMPYDVEGWKTIILKLKNDRNLRAEMAQNIQALLEKDYNSIYTGMFIKKDFERLIQYHH